MTTTASAGPWVELLRAARLQPITYPSAEAVLADTKHPEFDCLVLDIQLGAISGIDLRQRLAAMGDSTPVVFITAHDDPGVRVQAETSGCAGYFRKTDSGADILAAIRRAVSPADPTAAATSPATGSPWIPGHGAPKTKEGRQ